MWSSRGGEPAIQRAPELDSPSPLPDLRVSCKEEIAGSKEATAFKSTKEKEQLFPDANVCPVAGIELAHHATKAHQDDTVFNKFTYPKEVPNIYNRTVLKVGRYEVRDDQVHGEVPRGPAHDGALRHSAYHLLRGYVFCHRTLGSIPLPLWIKYRFLPQYIKITLII